MTRRAALLFVVVAAVAGGCADDPAVAPLFPGGSATVELRFGGDAGRASGRIGDGALATGAPCEPPAPGFPANLSGRIAITAASGTVTTTTFEIPAHTEQTTVTISGLAPGNGYLADVQLNESQSEASIFTGESSAFAILPGGATAVPVDLLPVDRRAVLGLGTISLAGSDELVVPVYAANSLPVRGIEFDLCFDPAVLDLETTAPIGDRASGFRAAGGEPESPGLLRAVLWSDQATARIEPGIDPVIELRFRFQTNVPAGTASWLVFQRAIVTDAPENPSFDVYYVDAQVVR
jgi:hypothetical protein